MSPSPPKEAEEAAEEMEEEFEDVEEEIEYEEVTGEEEEESEAAEEQNPKPKPKPSVPETIASFQTLDGALSDFLHHYNSLQQTLDFINSSLDGSSGSKTIKFEAVAADDRQLSELEFICRINSAKALRKYVLANLGEIDHLRREVPEALKLSPSPEKLVLDAMGRFYLQGRRAYERGDPNADGPRRAGILLLEFYVFAGCPVAAAENPSASVKESAREAAISWRNRLISEGGLETANAVDALGLTLLVASFGIPSEFRTRDLYSLLRLSNLKRKGDVLRRSPILVRKMPGIIENLIAKDMHVEAVDLVCTFGLEEQFPPLQLLSSFVMQISQKEANEKQLAALKSVVKCLEDHKLDTTELASLKIDQKIAMCEKEISKTQLKLHNKNVKRKFEDVDPRKIQFNQAKQLRPSAEAYHLPFLQSIRQLQEQRITDISDSRYAYSGYTVNNIPVSSEASHGLVDGNNLELLARNVHGSAGGWQGNTGYQSSVGLGTSYSSGYDHTRYSTATGQNIYHPPASGQNIYQPPASEQNIYQPPASEQNIYHSPAAGPNMYQQPAPGPNTYQQPASVQNIYQSPAAGQNNYHSPAAGQNIYQQPAPGPNIYQQPASVQHFYQPPVSSSLVTGGKNLVQFADTVSEQELPNNSAAQLPNYPAASNPVPNASTVTDPSHQSSYVG